MLDNSLVTEQAFANQSQNRSRKPNCCLPEKFDSSIPELDDNDENILYFNIQMIMFRG